MEMIILSVILTIITVTSVYEYYELAIKYQKYQELRSHFNLFNKCILVSYLYLVGAGLILIFMDWYNFMN